MKRNLVLPCICAMLLGLPNVRGQSISPNVINATGGFGAISGNTFEWSIGELMVSTATGSSVIITQGLLQPNAASTGIVENKLASQLEVFPNPASSIVNIHFNAPKAGSFTYRLVDVTGKVLIENTGDINAGTTIRQLDIKPLACAGYMLHILFTANGVAELSTTYKIQKLN